jgi:uncharacterized membrane protein YkgB
MAQEIAVLIPIVMFLIIGLILTTYIYFRSRERQMMIDKGMTPEQIAELFKSKKNPYTVLKLGIIIIFAGLGIGLGVIVNEAGYPEGLTPLLIITLTGIGFVAAFFAARKFEIEDKRNEP